MALRPCGSCGRHVRVSESACPFCRASLDPTPTPPSARVVGRLGRAAIFAFGAAAVCTIQGCSCGATHVADDAGTVVDTGGPAPLYGGAPDAFTPPGEDAGNISPPYGTPSEDAGTDGGLTPMYGTPPPDAGLDAADPIAPAYGGPPDPPDAGTDAGGGIAPLYGGSPGS